MLLFPNKYGRGTYSLTVGARTHVLWRRGVKPQNLPSDFREHSPSIAAWRMRGWLADGSIDRHCQCDVYREFNPSAFDFSGISHEQMATWFDNLVTSGQLVVGGFQKPIKNFDLGKFKEAQVRLGGGDVPKHVDPAPLTNQTTTYTVYEGSGGAAVPDEYDVTAANPTCPNAYHRSETLASASPEVRAWLDEFEKRDNGAYQEGLLGGDPDAGGGFLKGSTEVVTIPAGTPIWRYADDAKLPWGRWWFFHAYEGDPRSFAALPPRSSGNVLVQGQTKVEIQALCGPGAPRCTNKPGGPPQLCLPHSKPLPNSVETELLRLVKT